MTENKMEYDHKLKKVSNSQELDTLSSILKDLAPEGAILVAL